MKPHRCPVCYGEGRVPDTRFGSGTSAGPMIKPCRPCNGRGIVWEPVPYEFTWTGGESWWRADDPLYGTQTFAEDDA